jgi:hypothetical protein
MDPTRAPLVWSGERQDDLACAHRGHESTVPPGEVLTLPAAGLATLAGYLSPDDEVSLQDEHVQALDLDDDPDLVVIQVYVTSANRAYQIADRYRARGIRVVLGGLHVTSLPEEAARHADTIFTGPGEDTWPRFLADLAAGHPARRYHSTVRTLATVPPVRRDLIERSRYLVPNSIVVSRGCPHVCDFCYKEAFFAGGRSFYTRTVAATKPDWAGRGRHLAYSVGWKKLEPAWDLLIRARQMRRARPLLETVLSGRRSPGRPVIRGNGAQPSTDRPRPRSQPRPRPQPRPDMIDPGDRAASCSGVSGGGPRE